MNAGLPPTCVPAQRRDTSTSCPLRLPVGTLVSGVYRVNRVDTIRHLDIKLSYACNNNCIHCVVADQRMRALRERGRDHRTTAEVIAGLEDARQRGFSLVTFTGGEPTLRRDLALLVRRAVALGFSVGIQTNARVLCLAPAREALCGLGVRFVIALHGATAEVHDDITRAPGSFEQTRLAMQALASRGEKVTGKVVISRRNVASLPDISQVMIEAGVRRANFTFPHGLGNAALDYRGLVPRLSEVAPSLREAVERMERAKGEVVTEAVPLCTLKDLARIASEHHYRERVRTEVQQLDQGPRDWSRDRVLEGKAKADACRECPLDPRCEGVWREYIETYGCGELAPVK